MKAHFLNRIILFFGILFSFSSNACDGLDVNVISNVDLGNGTYEVTIQYCEEVSNGGTSSVWGIILDIGGANILSTSTPSFTSGSTGTTINYNVIDGNTVQWGEWDNNPTVPIFMDEGDPEECFTIVVIVDALITSVTVAGSSAPVDEGNGFVNWNGRWTCNTSESVPPPPCVPVPPTFNPIAPVCQNASVVLPTTSTNGQTGTWAPVVNTSSPGTINYTFTPSGGGCISSAVLPITVTSSITPTFNPIANVCVGAPSPILQGTSTNGITGTWSPATVNTATAGTQTYTFTPAPGGCATTTTLDVTVMAPTTPTFNPQPSVCVGAVVVLPITSTNGITGTWAPAVNTAAAGTTTYTFTPSGGSCPLTATLPLTVNAQTTPTFNPIPNQCQNAAAPALPGTSTNGITGTWAPATINTSVVGTQTYTFTPGAGQCAGPTTLNVTIIAATTPTFNPLSAVCLGTPVVLPTTSTNGISGTWSPAVNTAAAGTTVYTFTASAGCPITTTLSLTVNPLVTPTFTPVANICQGGVAPALPGTSTNGITGTWSPSTVNTSALGSTAYTFTPNAGQCATTNTLNITIITGTTPIFNPVAPVCINTPVVLPTTSTNGVVGTWAPAVNTAIAGTTTYTFTSSVGCLTTTTMPITVNALTTPTFNAIANICQNDAAPILPATSTNGITGTWAPATISTATVGTQTYTFTPSAGQCASTNTLNVTIMTIPVPDFNPLSSVCQNEVVVLPTTSTNGITGTWSPVVNTSTAGTTVYTFNSTSGSCPSTTTLSLTVIDIITPTFDPIPNVCVGAPAPVLPTTSTNGITGTWSSTVSTTTAGTFNFTFTPSPPTCNTNAQITVTIDPLPNVNAGLDQLICEGEEAMLSGSGAANYVWDNGVMDATLFTPIATNTYTVTGTDANGCQNTDDVEIVVAPLPVVDAGADQSICIGASINLTATGANTYVWDNGGANGQSVSPLTTTTYTVVGTIGNCTDDDEITITINPLPLVEFTPDVTTGCDPLDVNFTVQSPLGVSCVWDFGDGTTDVGCGGAAHTYNGIGCYDVRMTTTDANGCVNSQSYSNLICLVEYPVAEFGLNPPTITTTYPVSTMLNASQGAVSYLWDFGDGSATSTNTDPVHTFPYGEGNSYVITLVADNGYGCTDTAYHTITVEEDIIFYVPNSFTPDGDSYNQTFQPVFTSGFDPFDYSLFIYNRWGELIFESHNTEIGWDGKYAGSYEVQDGTYTWKIEFKQSINDKRRTEIGHVTIIR